MSKDMMDLEHETFGDKLGSPEFALKVTQMYETARERDDKFSRKLDELWGNYCEAIKVLNTQTIEEIEHLRDEYLEDGLVYVRTSRRVLQEL
jgi:hypothetical protein